MRRSRWIGYLFAAVLVLALGSTAWVMAQPTVIAGALRYVAMVPFSSSQSALRVNTSTTPNRVEIGCETDRIASATVNGLRVVGAATGLNPTLSALACTGGDANIGINLTPVGAGVTTITAGGLTITAGGLTITAGSLTVPSPIIVGTNPASAGTIRLPNAATLLFRNAANNADVTAFSVNASNVVTIGSGTNSGVTLGDGGADPVLLNVTGVLQLGGTAATFPGFKRTTTTIQVRLADDSANTDLEASRLGITGDYVNFSATLGTSGFGFRNNAGTMEFKNDAGAWAAVNNAVAAAGGWVDDGTIVRLDTGTDATIIGAATLDADVTAVSGAQFGQGIYRDTATVLHKVLVQSEATTNAATIAAFKTRAAGATNANTIVASGDGVFNLRGYGADGATYQPVATIAFAVDGTPGVGDMPGRIVLSTTLDGASAVTERLRITNAGVVQPGGDGTQDFGTSGLRWGLGYFGTALAVGTNPASAGALRLPNATVLNFRNAANGADIQALTVTAGDLVALGPSSNVIAGNAFVAIGASYADAGALRLANAALVNFRNAANNANIQALSVNASDQVLLGTEATLTAVYGAEQAGDLAAPAANGFVIYAKDVGAKTSLCARFNTGAVQCFATEP